MCFTSSSSLNITSWNLLNDHDGEVFHGVPAPIEVLSHWFQDLLVSDVISVAIEADVQSVLRQANVLFWALSALYLVNCALGLTVSRCAHLVGSLGHSASKRVGRFDVSTSLTPSAVAWPVAILFLLPGAFSDEDKCFHFRIHV